jgi:hypothetical protein
MYSTPASAGFTVYCKGEPARRCETFADFIHFVTALEHGRLERVEADADMPAANIYQPDIFALAFGGHLVPPQIDPSTPFGEILHQQVYYFILGLQRRTMFLGLQKEPYEFMKPVDEKTLARWKVLDAGHNDRPWMNPVTPTAKLTAEFQEELRRKGMTQSGGGHVKNGFDISFGIPRMFRSARSRALLEETCNCPALSTAEAAMQADGKEATLERRPSPQAVERQLEDMVDQLAGEPHQEVALAAVPDGALRVADVFTQLEQLGAVRMINDTEFRRLQERVGGQIPVIDLGARAYRPVPPRAQALLDRLLNLLRRRLR